MKQENAPSDLWSNKDDLELPNETKQKPSNEVKFFCSKEEIKWPLTSNW